MAINKYKVVCSQPRFSDHVYIDIAPSQGIIHDQIFFSRIQLHRQISNQPLSRLYGSIYLTDNNGDINVEFPSPQARKNTPDYLGCLKRYANLEQQIIECYKEMLKSGQESTLHIYGINQMVEISETNDSDAAAYERKQRDKRRFMAQPNEQPSDYKHKHLEQISPQTPQEEKRIQQMEQFSSIRKRRIATEQKRAADITPAWLRFQKEYSGD